MRIGIAGSEQDFVDRLGKVLDNGTTIVPCSLEELGSSDRRGLGAVVLGPGIPVGDALQMAQAIDSSTPNVGVVLMAEPHPRVLRAALLAGARDVWSPTIDDDELRASMDRIVALAQRRDAHEPTDERRAGRQRQVIVVLSPKGGAGKTTVATNLAFGIAGATEAPVGIIDLDLQFGDVATAMTMAPDRSIADAARAAANPTAVKAMMAAHPSGIHALCAPTDPADADAITPDATGRIIDALAEEFPTLIIDTSAGLDEHTLAAIDRATDLVVVSTTDIFAINGTRKLLDVLEQIDIGEPDRHLVLNRANARVDIERPEIERTLNWTVDVEIPSTRAVPLAMNRGETLFDAGRVARRPMLELLARFVDQPARKNGRRSLR